MRQTKIYGYMKSAGTYFAASLIPMLALALINPLIAINMSAQDYAVFGYYNSFSSLLSPLIVFYMIHYYTKRYYEVSPEERYRLKALLFKALIYFSFIVAVLCFVLLLGYILVLKKDFSFPIFPQLALAVFAIPLTGIYKLEQTDYKMARNASGFFRLTMAAGLVLVVTNLLFVVAIKLGSIGKLLAPFVANLLVFIWLSVRHRELFAVRTNLAELRTVLSFCLPLALGAMLGYFFNGYDRTYLESLGDVTTYGNYIVGAQFAGYLVVFSTAVSSTFQPDIYESIARNDRRSFFSTCLLVVGSVTVIIILFILFCPLILRIFTAGRYVDAAPFARVISLSVVASSIYYIINNYTIAKGYPRLYLLTTLIVSALTVVVYPPVVASHGYMGGAAMTVIPFLMLAVVNLILLITVRFLGNSSSRSGRMR